MLTFLVAAILLVLLIKFAGQIVQFMILAAILGIVAIVVVIVVGIALAEVP